MSRQRSLEWLIELGRRARDEAALGVAKAVRSERRERELRETLGRYQDEYRQASPKRRGNATGATQVELHRRFVDRLAGAVVDQQQREARAVDARRASEQVLGQAERRVQALQRLQARRQAAERLRQQRLEQKVTDEQAAMLARRSRSR